MFSCCSGWASDMMVSRTSAQVFRVGRMKRTLGRVKPWSRSSRSSASSPPRERRALFLRTLSRVLFHI